jgi:hypothetical protein
MKIITDLRDRVIKVNEDLTSGKMIQKIIQENEAAIIDMNAQEQLFESGENSLGVSIASYAPYTPITIEIKRMKGQPTNRVTLRDEGDFESSFYLVISDKQFEIKASDWKTEELVEKYGSSILGLTKGNIASLTWDYIYPELMDTFKKELYGKQ